MKRRLVLIDGQGLCYRAFYAIRELSNSKGEPTNAIYGFVNMLRKLIREQKPDYLAVCFDRKEPTFRHERYEEYKAQRKPMPDELITQIPHIKEFVEAFRIPLFEKPGYEADDLIGTIAKEAERKGFNVVIVTGDKDMLQLVDEKVQILNTYKENIVDSEGVKERFGGLGPERVVDVLSLSGDSSDNIPGIPGIGEKTAIELMKHFGSLENLYRNLNQLSVSARKKTLEENEQIARLSRDLATIDCAVPIDLDLEALKLKTPDPAVLTELLKRFEFRSLLQEYAQPDESEKQARTYHAITSEDKLDEWVSKLSKAKAVAVDTETTSTDPLRARLIGVSFSFSEKEAFYAPVSLPALAGEGLEWEHVRKKISPVLEGETIKKYGQNIKYDLIVLKRHGVNLRGIVFDTMIASYLINPIKLNHNLDDISFEYLGVKKIALEDLIGTGRKQISTDQVPLEDMAEYAAEDADCVFRLVNPLSALLKEHGLQELFNDLELPLLSVLAQMEMNGMALDVKLLKKLSDELGRDLELLTKKIHKEAGEEFNINSTKQLADILFAKLKLPVMKRTKTGYSTDAEVLEKLAQSYSVPKLLLEYRGKAKLKSTYLDALPELINPETGLVHTSFNQTVTSTGRLSSSEPNLQNIPVKTELGRSIRKAFIPREKGRKILSADYSQVELRILAHLSKDFELTKAFRDGLDVHEHTATLLYHAASGDVTREMRNAAKTINFSIVYGVSAFGLAQSLGTSVSEAQTFIDSYFERYGGVREYLEAQKQKAREQGYLTTLFGRRSYFPEINASNPTRRQFAERAAINAPIQGSAADIIKRAMVDIQAELNAKRLKSLMILQVHDELVFDAPSEELADLEYLVRKRMEGACKLDVPLKVDVTIGENWCKD